MVQKSKKVKPSHAANFRTCSVKCWHALLRDGKNYNVTLVCKECGNDFERRYIQRATRFCSPSCRSKGKNNGMYGKPGPMRGRKAWNNGLTAETDERLAAAGKKISPIIKQQFVVGKRSHDGANNPNYGKTRNDRTPEQLEKYSRAAVQRVIDCVSCSHDNSKYDRGWRTSTKMGIDMYFRSSYERRVMECFDADDTIKKFEFEPFAIKLRTGRRYIPDFIVHYKNGRKLMIETKPLEFIDYPDVEEKATAARNFCMNNGLEYEIWTDTEIRILEHQLGLVAAC